jgi:hypothetical protein
MMLNIENTCIVHEAGVLKTDLGREFHLCWFISPKVCLVALNFLAILSAL